MKKFLSFICAGSLMTLVFLPTLLSGNVGSVRAQENIPLPPTIPLNIDSTTQPLTAPANPEAYVPTAENPVYQLSSDPQSITRDTPGGPLEYTGEQTTNGNGGAGNYVWEEPTTIPLTAPANPEAYVPTAGNPVQIGNESGGTGGASVDPNKDKPKGGVKKFVGAIVPCVDDCTICHIFEMITRLVKFMWYNIALPATIIAFLYGGIVWTTAGGNVSKVEKGKRALWMALIGLIIAFAAWLIVDAVMKTLASGTFWEAWGPWNSWPGCSEK